MIYFRHIVFRSETSQMVQILSNTLELRKGIYASSQCSRSRSREFRSTVLSTRHNPLPQNRTRSSCRGFLGATTWVARRPTGRCRRRSWRRKRTPRLLKATKVRLFGFATCPRWPCPGCPARAWKGTRAFNRVKSGTLENRLVSPVGVGWEVLIYDCVELFLSLGLRQFRPLAEARASGVRVEEPVAGAGVAGVRHQIVATRTGWDADTRTGLAAVWTVQHGHLRMLSISDSRIGM